MGKNKLKKFADMDHYDHVFQLSYNDILKGEGFPMQGKWNEQFFNNDKPIVLELGCGRGEYTIGLAQQFPDKNFIGVDIKGSRMWSGATQAQQLGLQNVAFIRTGINVIDHFFGPDEVSELWITFADPQMKKVNKRLTSTYFLSIYQHFLKDLGTVHLKSDSHFLYTYTHAVAQINQLPITEESTNLYRDITNDPILSIKTYYEQQWLARGLDIKYLQFSLPKSQNLLEPQIEIELDDYRSYGRQKRSELSTTL